MVNPGPVSAPGPAPAGDRPMGDRPMGDRPPGDRPAGDRPPGPRGPRPGGKDGRPRPKYAPRRKVCAFCVDKVENIDYKEPGKLRRFISDRGKIEPRRKTGTCARHQRRLAMAIKRARMLALVPYTAEHIRLTGGVGVRA